MKTILLSLILILTASAGAQELERAEELLGSAARALPPLRTIDVTSTKQTSTIEEGPEKTHRVIDLLRQRLYIEAESDDVEFVLRYVDGVTSMEIAGYTKTYRDGSWGIAEELSARLQGGFGVIPKDYNIVSYDGFKRYGDAVEGEQVTLRYTTLFNGNAEGKFIFDVLGKPLAAVVNDGFLSDDDIILYDIEVAPNGLQMDVTTRIYTAWKEEGFLFSDQRQRYLFNQPVDQSLFEVENNQRL